jgi:endonuclease-3
MANKQNWLNDYKKIKIMRKEKNAPVDTMGAHALADENSSPKVYRFQCFVAALLSSRTRDEKTYLAMNNLKKHGLEIDNILNTSLDEIKILLKPVGFANKKSKYLKDCCQILKNEYNNDVPKTLKELLKLPGIGKKMGTLILQNAWNINDGISVDVHVNRISNRLKWVNTKKPDITKDDLEDLIPDKYWMKLNPTIVGFGQQICLPRNPKCNKCLLKHTCPSSSIKI